jgi:hypothetical protein
MAECALSGMIAKARMRMYPAASPTPDNNAEPLKMPPRYWTTFEYGMHGLNLAPEGKGSWYHISDADPLILRLQQEIQDLNELHLADESTIYNLLKKIKEAK